MYMNLKWNPLSRYNDMAAGLKSTYYLSKINWIPKINRSVPSRDPPFLRSRSGILDDHPLLRTLVKLVASHRRFVYILLLSLSPSL
jgi:hypothetical protein